MSDKSYVKAGLAKDRRGLFGAITALDRLRTKNGRLARGSQSPGDMNHQLPKQVASIVTLMLLSTFVAGAQVRASQPAQPTELQAKGRGGGDLIESIKRGDLAEVSKVLIAGTSADEADDEGGRPLCWAVRVNRRDIAELLLAHGAEINKEEDDGGTALVVAAGAGHADMVKLLLTHGADANHKDNGGHTALLLAAGGAVYGAMPPFLLKAIFGGEATERGDQFLSSMGTEHREVMELLLQAGADANLQADDCGLTALMFAGLGGSVKLVQMLLSHGANVNLKTGEWDALRFAEAFESSKAIAELDEEDAETKQALLIWSQTTAPGRQQVAKLLRAAGARH